MKRIPVNVREGEVIYLSPGGQNALIDEVLHEFAERFTPGGDVLYIGDTGEKFAYFDEARLKALGVSNEVRRRGDCGFRTCHPYARSERA